MKNIYRLILFNQVGTNDCRYFLYIRQRKRERVDQEDDQEFMPLSKRINNIHLSPERMIQGVHPAFTHPGSSQNVHGHQSNNLVYPSTSTSDFPLQNGFHDSSKGHSAFHSDGSEFRHRNLQEIPPQRSDYTNSNDTLHALVARSSMNSSEQQNNISFQSNQQLRVQVRHIKCIKIVILCGMVCGKNVIFLLLIHFRCLVYQTVQSLQQAVVPPKFVIDRR